jgi:dTDP-4-amino-4,6-dideoxygalactose transaminase
MHNRAISITHEPVRKNFLPFHCPVITEDEITAVVEVLESGWLTTGSKVKEFEDEFRRFVRSPYAVAVNSGTAALHLALAAVGIQEGDEVIVPTMTFAATAEVVLYLRAKPVLIDCEPGTLNMDPGKLETAIGPKTKAVIPVHFGGHPCDMRRILEIGRAHRLKVIEDAAHALPAAYQGQTIGSIGDITCFSFYATKTITTGEGGMATTANPEWANTMRILSLHGISHDAWKRYSAEGSWYYEILSPGYKYNLTDVAASLGVEQLEKCRDFHQARKRIAEAYREGFSDLPEIVTPPSDPNVQHAWHLYVIQLELDRLTIDRGQFIEALKEENIGTSVHFIPLHLHPYYRDTFGYRPQEFPVAYSAFERIVSLPIYPRMTTADVDDVIGAVRGIVEQYRR